MLLPRATGETVRAIWTGSSGATARCSPSPTSRCRSRCRRAAAPSWPSPTSRTACAPSRCCASTTRSSPRARASLRRIAALVAGGAASAEVFAAIAREVAGVLGVSLVAVWRYESDGTGTVVGAWSEPPHLLRGRAAAGRSTTRRSSPASGRPAVPRGATTSPTVHGTIADIVREAGIRSAAGAPIVVDGDVWGVMAAGATEGERLPGPHRGSARRVHRAGRHHDLEQREPRGARPARGRAGRAAARGDAGRPRRPAAGGVCSGRA